MKDKDRSSLDHPTWRCQYHIVFAPKFRRMVIYKEIKVEIGKVQRQLCQQKGVEIIASEGCSDHMHMLVSIPPKYSVSQIMGSLKGKSSLMIFDRHTNLSLQEKNQPLWNSNGKKRTKSFPAVFCYAAYPVPIKTVPRFFIPDLTIRKETPLRYFFIADRGK